MTSSPPRDQNTPNSSSSNKPRKRIVYCSSSDDEVVPPDFVSNSTPSQINYEPFCGIGSSLYEADHDTLSLDYSDIYPCVSMPRRSSPEYKEAKSSFDTTPNVALSTPSISSLPLGQRSTSSLRHLSERNPVRL